MKSDDRIRGVNGPDCPRSCTHPLTHNLALRAKPDRLESDNLCAFINSNKKEDNCKNAFLPHVRSRASSVRDCARMRSVYGNPAMVPAPEVHPCSRSHPTVRSKLLRWKMTASFCLF